MKMLSSLLVAVFLASNVAAPAEEAKDRAACLREIRELSMLTTEFAAAHEGRLPKSFEELLSAKKSPNQALPIASIVADKNKPSYELLLSGAKLSSIANPARTISIRSLYTLKDGKSLAAFVDGHVEILDAKP